MSGKVVFVGTCGWHYDDWRGAFYPPDLPRSRWLDYYSARFAAVEVDNTFYRLPEARTFARWREGSAPGFVFAIKASRYITHMKRLRGCRMALRRLETRVRRLGEKMGPLLVQLPYSFKADVPRLAAFLDDLRGRFRPAFELRHPSWDRDDVRDLLDRAGAALVLADAPGARVAPRVTGGWSFVRFHKGTRSGPDYGRAKLRRWADRVLSLEAREVWAFFNNDPTGAAVRDAIAFRRMLGVRGLTVSPDLADWSATESMHPPIVRFREGTGVA